MSVNQAVLELLVKMKDEASAGLSSLTSSLGGLGTLAGGAALAGVVAFGAALTGGVADARNSQQLLAATEQVLHTTGNAAGVSAQHIVDYASALSDAAGASLFGDDQIQQSENLLLTFTNIKGATLDTATALSVDLAQALGGAPKDQAIALGKALNDPTAGITALTRVGVTFTDQQKEQIKTMQAAGDMAGAQAIITNELAKEFGGQAAAAAKAAGGLVQFQAGLGETFETLGSKLLPVLDQLGAWLASPEVQAAITELADNLANGIGVAVDYLSNVAIPALMQAWTEIEPTVMTVVAFLRDVVGPILLWLATTIFEGLKIELAALAWAWTNVLLPGIKAVIAWFQSDVLPVLTALYVALRDDLPRGVDRAVAGWESLKVSLASFKEQYLDPIGRGFTYVVDSIDGAKKQFDGFIAGVQGAVIPPWLQGHSPPPLADWFSYIADAATDAGGAMDAAVPTGGNLPVGSGGFGAGGGAGGGAATNVYITIEGSVLTEGQFITKVRDGLNKIGFQNISIFSGDVVAG